MGLTYDRIFAPIVNTVLESFTAPEQRTRARAIRQQMAVCEINTGAGRAGASIPLGVNGSVLDQSRYPARVDYPLQEYGSSRFMIGSGGTPHRHHRFAPPRHRCSARTP